MKPAESKEFVEAVRQALFPEIKLDQPLPGKYEAFLITAHVAWQLRHLNYGLVRAKEGSENNYQGYTTDVVCRLDSDGYHVDVLGDSGTSNFAAWQPNENIEHWKAIKPRMLPPIDVGEIFGGTSNGDPDADKDLKEQVAELRKQIDLLVANSILVGQTITLRSNNQDNPKPYVCADSENGNHLIANRAAANNWEEFIIERRG